MSNLEIPYNKDSFILYTKDDSTWKEILKKNPPYYESNLLVVPVVYLVSKFGKKLVNLIAENLNLNLTGVSATDNYYKLEEKLKESKTKLIIINDIHNLLYSLKPIDVLVMVSQIMALSKELKISFVMNGSVASDLLTDLNKEFNGTLLIN